MSGTKLVMGASGFLGSHVTRELVARGENVRVLVRTTSSTRGIDGLDVERHYGDVFDTEAIRTAMRGCDVVYYCVVDTRAWLRDTHQLFRTNVEGLRNVLDVAVEAGLSRFVFTSTIGTLAIDEHRLVDESTPHNWAERGGAYIQSRVAAEELVLRYSRERGLPAVAMCVANTYGPGDHVPTGHGGLVAAAARGRLPVYVRGVAAEVVGVQDAARALVLAGEKGRPGRRYIVAERFMTMREVHDIAADATGAPRARWGIPLWGLYAVGYVSEFLARITGRPIKLTPVTVRLMHTMTPLDHSKAARELGWTPAPTPDAIRAAAHFFTS